MIPMRNVKMISDNCNIEEFVEAMKNRDIQDVIAMAVEEATSAGRMALRKHKKIEYEPVNSEQYVHQLEQLINYHRYSVEPTIPKSQVYQLYTAYWGHSDR
jgi:hypothetical protein